MPVIAPAATRYCIQVSPARLNASTTGASILISLEGTMPVKTADTAMYNSVQMTSDAMMPTGTSWAGFRASSEWTDTESNPMYAKKMIAAPAIMPSGSPPAAVWPNNVCPKKLTPVKPNGANGCQLDGLT